MRRGIESEVGTEADEKEGREGRGFFGGGVLYPLFFGGGARFFLGFLFVFSLAFPTLSNSSRRPGRRPSKTTRMPRMEETRWRLMQWRVCGGGWLRRVCGLFLVLAICPACRDFRAQQEKKPPSTAKLDINIATYEQIHSLPGIGPVTTQRILDFRKRADRFSVEDLMAVRGISSAAGKNSTVYCGEAAAATPGRHAEEARLSTKSDAWTSMSFERDLIGDGDAVAFQRDDFAGMIR